jgi:hypothetical protein
MRWISPSTSECPPLTATLLTLAYCGFALGSEVAGLQVRDLDMLRHRRSSHLPTRRCERPSDYPRSYGSTFSISSGHRLG